MFTTLAIPDPEPLADHRDRLARDGIAVEGQLGHQRAGQLDAGLERAPERRVGPARDTQRHLAHQRASPTPPPPGSPSSGSCPDTAGRRCRRPCGRSPPRRRSSRGTAARRAPSRSRSRCPARSSPGRRCPARRRSAPRPAPSSCRRCRPRPGSPSRSDITSAKARSASGRLTACTALPVRRSNVHGMPKPTAATSPPTAAAASSTACDAHVDERGLLDPEDRCGAPGAARRGRRRPRRRATSCHRGRRRSQSRPIGTMSP